MEFKSLATLYKNDPTKSADGIPFEIGTNPDGSAITMVIAEANAMVNKKFAATLRKYDRALELSRKNPDRRNTIWVKIVAESLLMDWENVLDTEGKPVEATLANKINALTKYNELVTEVLSIANDRSNYVPDDGEAVEQDTEKNSLTPPAGT
jgi:hypothetical protein